MVFLPGFFKNRMASLTKTMNYHDWCYSMPKTQINTEIHLRGEDFRWKVCDVRGDGAACQELCNFVGEGVAVVLKQAVPVSSVGAAKDNISRQCVGSLCFFGMLCEPY